VLELGRPDLTMRLGGRLMIDGSFGLGTDLQFRDPVEVRRGRLFLLLSQRKHWREKVSVEFSRSQPRFKDAWIDYRSSTKRFGLTIGQFQEPFGLENLTSSKYITFMERALPNVMVPRYHLGIGARARGEHWSAAGGVFGGSILNGGLDVGATGWGASGRLTFSPVHHRDRVLHFGISGLYRAPDARNSLRFRTRPEMDLVDVPRITSRTMNNVDHWWGLGFEAAAVWGPFSVQGEYIRSDVQRSSGRTNVVADGWYAYASWFLTGESRRYRSASGVFGRVKPRRRWGAVELGFRLSRLDFDSPVRRAGTGNSMTFGINWYVTSQVRLMANYVRADVDNRSASSNLDLFGLRFQLDF